MEKGFWDDAAVVSVYDDMQALEDGVLVDISSLQIRFKDVTVNRCTAHLFTEMVPFCHEQGKADGFLALVHDGFENCREVEHMDLGKFATAIRTKIKFAQGSGDNTGEVGDIYKLPPNLWLFKNEVGGYTLMFPEDY
jgi:hypothetical protein